MQADLPTTNPPAPDPRGRNPADQDPSPWRSRVGLLRRVTLGVAVVWAVLCFVATRRLWSQTGYLHLAFARSLAANEGFGVQGKAVFGDASPLWIVLLAGCHDLLRVFAPDWLVTGKVLTAGTAIFFVAGLYRFAEQLVLAAGTGARRTVPAAVVLIVLVSPFWGPEAFTGTEVLAAAGLACWACALVSGPLTAAIRPPPLLAACLCAGCGPLLRPEMLLFSICLAPFLFVRWVNTPLRFALRVRVFFVGLLLAVAPGAGWLFYTLRIFGTALPNTVDAGRGAPDSSALGQGIAQVGVGAPWLLVGLVGLITWLARRHAVSRTAKRPSNGLALPVDDPKPNAMLKLDPSAWIPVAWAVLTTLFYLATHTALTAREVLLLAPACTAFVFAAVSLLSPRILRFAGPVCVAYGLAASLLLSWPAVGVDWARQQVYAELSQFLRGLPATDRTALAPVGEVLFHSAHPVIDLGGVLDPSALAFRWETTDARRVWWAHEKGARLMLLDHPPEPGSEALWSQNVPALLWLNVVGGKHTSDRIVLWRLPPSPTLPMPVALPDHPE